MTTITTTTMTQQFHLSDVVGIKPDSDDLGYILTKVKRRFKTTIHTTADDTSNEYHEELLYLYIEQELKKWFQMNGMMAESVTQDSGSYGFASSSELKKRIADLEDYLLSGTQEHIFITRQTYPLRGDGRTS